MEYYRWMERWDKWIHLQLARKMKDAETCSALKSLFMSYQTDDKNIQMDRQTNIERYTETNK